MEEQQKAAEADVLRKERNQKKLADKAAENKKRKRKVMVEGKPATPVPSPLSSK